jgi:hypothetical protein
LRDQRSERLFAEDDGLFGAFGLWRRFEPFGRRTQHIRELHAGCHGDGQHRRAERAGKHEIVAARQPARQSQPAAPSERRSSHRFRRNDGPLLDGRRVVEPDDFNGVEFFAGRGPCELAAGGSSGRLWR